MVKTKEKPRTIETVEAELEEVRTRLAEMRSELARPSKPPQADEGGRSTMVEVVGEGGR